MGAILLMTLLIDLNGMNLLTVMKSTFIVERGLLAGFI